MVDDETQSFTQTHGETNVMATNVTIDGVEFQPVTAVDQRPAIVVCDRGFVLAGLVSLADSYWTIQNCVNLRRWGTTKGLGQLATSGPTDNTVMDPQPVTRVHELQVVQIIDIEAASWSL